MSNIAKHTYTKMNQDISKSKFSPEIFFEGRNIRVLTNEAFGSITNAKGNELKATIPDIPSNPTNKSSLNKLPYPLTNPTIVGHEFINENLYIFSNYPAVNENTKLFYAQEQNVNPYIDSNIRVLVDNGNGLEIVFEDFFGTNGAVEGPVVPTGTPIRIQAFHLASEPNDPAPAPHLYLEVYKNGVLIETLVSALDYVNSVTLAYNFTADVNTVYFFHAYTLPEPGTRPNPFTNINIFDFIVENDIFTIHKINSDYGVELKFIDDYNIGNNKLDVWGFYENQLNQKLYWANGKDPISFINIANPDSINLDRKFLSTVPDVTLSQPTIIGFSSAGSHTAGSIQYGYNLYQVNGAQTRISPLTNIVYLNDGDRGNDVNTRVSKSPRLLINNIDTEFDRIRVYSIKYNSLNSTPEIKIIFETNTAESIEIIDDNNANLATISLPEFLFLGGDKYIPKHIFIKDSRLFLANYKTQELDIDFDARAYRFDKDGNTVITDATRPDITSSNFTPPIEVPVDFDAINPTNKAEETSSDYNKYIWKTATGGGFETTTRPASFNDIFEVFSNNNQFTERFYDDNNQEIAFQIWIPGYSTSLRDTTTILRLKSSFTFVGVNSSGNTNYNDVVPSCFNPVNYPGDNEWEVNYFNGELRLTTRHVTDSRCASPSEQPRSVTIILSDGVQQYNIAFSIKSPQSNEFDAGVEITDFAPNGLTVSETTVVPVTGVLGGIGPNVEYELKYRTLSSNVGQPTMSSEPSMATTSTPSELTSLKSGEVYRMFLEFQLQDGRYLFPKWIGDVKIPEIGSVGSLPPVDSEGNINYCYIETKLNNVPQDPRIIGWRTSIVERTEFDKNVITQGIYNPSITNDFNQTIDEIPSYFQRTFTREAGSNNNSTEIRKPKPFNTLNTNALNLSSNDNDDNEITAKNRGYLISSFTGSMYTPEVILNKRLSTASAKVRVTGLVRNTQSTSHREVYNNNGLIVDELNGIDGTNLSRSVTEPGARLLMNLVTSNINNRKRLSKFISDNNDGSNQIYSRRKHAFVRYFGGYNYTYIPNQIGNYIDMTSETPFRYTAPIINVYNINQFATLGFTKAYSSNGSIRVQLENDTLLETGLDYLQGSAITFAGLAFNFETLGANINPSDFNDYGLMMELYRIVENQYGGDTYNARQLNRTIPYSNLVPITENTTTVHVGDTFIQKFNFLKTFNFGANTNIQVAEIVSIPVETSINLDLRWDILKNRGNNFDADELTSYGFNRAYDQQNNTIRGVPKPFNFTEINEFPVNIIPSKLKIAGELIDSFTDFLVNDIKTLDGRYGEIAGVGEHSDNVFAFQRNAVAYLAINPRVQLQTNDAIPIELGSGGIIERYQYLTTNSGTLNKWSIVKTNNGLMYVDLLNKSINFIGADNNKMSTVNGLYNKLFTYIDTHYDDLVIDNPVVNKGIIAHYDNLKEETYFTFLTGSPFTVSYNGLAQGFVSLYDFFPNHYMTVNGKMLTTNDNISIWEHNTPDSLYNTFYGDYFPSHITVITNQYPDINKIYDNIHFNSEFYTNEVDLSNITFNKLLIENEYQTSGKITIDTTLYKTMSKRRFRKWNFILPRQQNSRNRINSPWVAITLEFDKSELPAPLNTQDIRLVLHDLLVSFTPKP